MKEKEKRKNTPRRIYYLLLPAGLVIFSALLAYLFLKNADNAPDIVFLHAEADGFPQIYGFNLDSENLASSQALALTQPDAQLSYITGYDIRGDWLIYAQSEDPMRFPEPIQSELVLLNWRSGEKSIFLDCDAIGLNCISSILRFSNDGGTIFLHDTISYPPTVWMLDTKGSEPQIFAQHEGIASITWIADNAFLYHYRDDDHNSHDMLYNIDTRSITDLTDIFYYEQLGSIIAISPDNQSLFSYISVSSAEYMGQEARPSINHYDLSTRAQEIYQIPEDTPLLADDYGSLLPLYWYPDQSAFLYFSTNSGLVSYDLATESFQLVWPSEEKISDIQWNADGSQFVFVRGSGWDNQGELWLYDMEAEEALPLPVLGYSVQWIEGE
jgi:hypothetical protein